MDYCKSAIARRIANYKKNIPDTYSNVEKYLIPDVADICMQYLIKDTTMHFACLYGCYEFLERNCSTFALNNSKSENQNNSDANDYFEMCCENGHIHMVKLISRHILRARPQAFLCAINSGDLELVKFVSKCCTVDIFAGVEVAIERYRKNKKTGHKYSCYLSIIRYYYSRLKRKDQYNLYLNTVQHGPIELFELFRYTGDFFVKASMLELACNGESTDIIKRIIAVRGKGCGGLNDREKDLVFGAACRLRDDALAHRIIDSGFKEGTSFISHNRLWYDKAPNKYNIALYVACLHSREKIIERLIKLGANNWDWGLLGACEAENFALAEQMLNLGATAITSVLSAICGERANRRPLVVPFLLNHGAKCEYIVPDLRGKEY